MNLHSKLKVPIVTIGLVSLYVVAFYPVWKELIIAWMVSDEYSHGVLILPISGYLTWRKRTRLTKIPVSSSWSTFGLVAISLIIYFFGKYAEIKTVAWLSLVLFIFGAVIFLFGLDIAKELIFPLIFLFFMIPIPAQIYSQITLPLQLLVTKSSVWFISALGFSVYSEGNMIHLADRSLEVAQACSGLRSMISILPMTALLGYLTLQSNLLRLILLISGIPVAILINVVRIIVLIFALEFLKVDLTRGGGHTVFGMILFGISLLLILFARGVLKLWDKSTAEKSL